MITNEKLLYAYFSFVIMEARDEPIHSVNKRNASLADPVTWDDVTAPHIFLSAVTIIGVH